MKITAEKNDTQNAKSNGAISTNPVNPVANGSANGKGVADQLSDTKKGEDAMAAVKAEPVTAKFALNLDETLKLVEKLAKKTVQRDRYNGYIKTLEDFVVEQQDEEDFGEDANNYKGCELTIKDSKGNVFYTERSTVIGPTIQFMADRFKQRLAEVEAEIVIPS
ncbi:hypothetical protein HDF26_002295 [Pedobacter cryoconitis]|uniref:hypothetical protein n=1 Tax=Pedobacter cryoconitis TaxID=188932 RepID=UPI001613A758|nr:hypothetical protein [Pedobacter cryoconitis]MBB6271838.1 hypothetical protein [Pedobacter cryoconitis]